ncbi:9119_t:CDS:2 [Gigaspora rosea]|nr:9119_t:CDS:2 [Gigaspora rosea]
MGVFDPTKPIYTSHENIEEFLIYFEAYAASKDWDDNKKCINNLRAAMITNWATSSDINEKLECLKNMVQEAGDTVQIYTNCFDAYIAKVKNQLRDLEKREWYIQGLQKKYDRDREYISKSSVRIATGEVNKSGKNKLDKLPSAHEAKRICRVGEQHFLNTERLDRMETSIVELVKAVQTLMERRGSLSPHRSPASNMTQNRGYVGQNRGTTPQRSVKYKPSDQAGGPDIRGADVRFFEVTEKAAPKGDEYLMIHVEADKALFDVRNLGKRRRSIEDEAPVTLASKRKKAG